MKNKKQCYVNELLQEQLKLKTDEIKSVPGYTQCTQPYLNELSDFIYIISKTLFKQSGYEES
jgi:hypothetical protein